MSLREETKEIQELLGEYCRTGEDLELPGLTMGNKDSRGKAKCRKKIKLEIIMLRR